MGLTPQGFYNSLGEDASEEHSVLESFGVVSLLLTG